MESTKDYFDYKSVACRFLKVFLRVGCTYADDKGTPARCMYASVFAAVWAGDEGNGGKAPCHTVYYLLHPEWDNL